MTSPFTVAPITINSFASPHAPCLFYLWFSWCILLLFTPSFHLSKSHLLSRANWSDNTSDTSYEKIQLLQSTSHIFLGMYTILTNRLLFSEVYMLHCIASPLELLLVQKDHKLLEVMRYALCYLSITHCAFFIAGNTLGI